MNRLSIWGKNSEEREVPRSTKRLTPHCVVLTFFGFCHAFLPQLGEDSRYRRINNQLILTAKRGRKANLLYAWSIVVVLLICFKVWGDCVTSQKKKKKKVCVGGYRLRARIAGLKGEGEARGIGHFQNNKIQHNSESYRTQTMKMTNIWARESPFSPAPRPLSPSSFLSHSHTV